MLLCTARTRQSPEQHREHQGEESEIAVRSKSSAHPNLPARSVPGADRIAAAALPGSPSSASSRVCIHSAFGMQQLVNEARMLCSAQSNTAGSTHRGPFRLLWQYKRDFKGNTCLKLCEVASVRARIVSSPVDFSKCGPDSLLAGVNLMHPHELGGEIQMSTWPEATIMSNSFMHLKRD